MLKTRFNEEALISRATTRDYMILPDDVGGNIYGRSSLGRWGVYGENTAWVDPDFEAEITRALKNTWPRSVRFYHGMRIAQSVLVKLDEMPDKPDRVLGKKSHRLEGAALQQERDITTCFYGLLD